MEGKTGETILAGQRELVARCDSSALKDDARIRALASH